MTVDEQIKKAYDNKVTKVHKNLVRETAIRAYGNFIQSSPVDTGRFRANWTISVNTINTATTENTAMPDLKPAIQYEAGTIYISNHLPYAQRLNDGYSQQAPANFVEKGLALAVRQAETAAKRGAR